MGIFSRRLVFCFYSYNCNFRMSSDEKDHRQSGAETEEVEKGGKKRKHEETAPQNIPSTSGSDIPGLELPPWVAG